MSLLGPVTGYTPSELFLDQNRYDSVTKIFEFPPNLTRCTAYKFILANERQQTKALQRRRRYDRQRILVEFEIGDLVLVQTHKLSSSVDRCISKFFLCIKAQIKLLI